MLAKVRSGALIGIDAVVVDVEVDMTLGLPYINVVGLAEGAVKESKVRVLSALKNSGFELPQKRVTVNLAPADIRKEGALFELPIALGVLAAAKQLEYASLEGYLFGGELSLDGWLKPIRGVLPLAIAARDSGIKRIMVPAQNAAEAALVDQIEVIPVGDIRSAVDHLSGVALIAPYRDDDAKARRKGGIPLDIADVRGQDSIKIALEIAAAGGHNILMSGPPGSGKTMLARRIPTILPEMTFQEALEVTKLYSVMGLLKDGVLVSDRPFRAPHHTISYAGLVGGGNHGRPGELSMAHNGVLFLDELPEFRRSVLEMLRQPLEDGTVHLARANHNVSFPCRFMLVAAMNPCPCGYRNVAGHECKCKEVQLRLYGSRISGPLLDRIDLTLETRAVELRAMMRDRGYEKPSEWYRERVKDARDRQLFRFREETGVYCNAQMQPQMLERYCRLSGPAQEMLLKAAQMHRLSARSHDRILKIARTAADIEGREDITEENLGTALYYRQIQSGAPSAKGFRGTGYEAMTASGGHP